MYMKSDLLRNPYKLVNLQLFSEPGGNDEGGEDNHDQEVPMIEKSVFDKLSSDYAALKKTLKERETDDEKFAREQAEKDDRIAELERNQNKSILEKGFMKSGITDKDAEKISEAILSGDMNKISTEISRVFTDSTTNLQKEIDALKLTQIDKPGGSNEDKQVTLEEYSKMTIDEKIALKNSDPDLFKELRDKYENR